ncbi:uncharacterized protein LOC121867522 isoform X2 [Homarus americanus]|uniref:uncharacterized protein LOC121867522 isoform X2 n=1 Tax=Homarus americanus TaxID=6706 RepID=UPI001C4877B5|nr:uncharacterized protein LOC121867522 isoform X2 [Homarus americanus]
MEETIPAIEGTLVALSHTLKINGILLLAELCCQGKIQHVLARQPTHIPWQQQMQLFSRVRITNLKTQIISEGIITAVIDEASGIYELDGKTRLVITYLLEVTGELWNENLENVNETNIPSNNSTEKNAPYRCLEEGDSVMLHRVHHTKINGTLHLICCGRSLVEKNRNTPINTSKSLYPNAHTGLVHIYNPGIVGVMWLLTLQDQMVTTLCQGWIDDRHVKWRKLNGEYGLLIELMEKAAFRKLIAPNTRCLAKEFLCPDHQCVVTQEFVAPFDLVTVASLTELQVGIDKIRDENIHNEKPSLWCHFVDHSAKPRVLVGKLVVSDSGILQIQQQESKISVVIVGDTENLLSKVGGIVALFDFAVVVEEFNMIKEGTVENICIRYIMIKSSDMYILKKQTQISQGLKGDKNYSVFKIKIISKSGLLCSPLPITTSASYSVLSNMYFMIHGGIMHEDCQSNKNKKWQTLLKFSVKNALIHSCIEEGHWCILKIPDALNVEQLKKKYWTNTSREFQSYFSTIGCVYLPDNSSVVDVIDEKHHHGCVNITQVVNPEFEGNVLVSVVGTVKERAFMTDKYSSNTSNVSSDVFREYHIGIPESKIFMVLLEDVELPGCKVWLYFNDHKHSTQYPLGILSGVTIHASYLRRKTSQQTLNVYLQNTKLTSLHPVTMPVFDICNGHCVMRSPRYYLQNIKEHSGIFRCFATVEKILKVTFSTVCSYCRMRIINGFCTYVGCKAPSSNKILASATLIINDGTATALMFMHSLEQVRVVLHLTHEQYSSLTQYIISGSHEVTYYSKAGYGLDESQSDSGLLTILKTLCSNDQLMRPLVFTCRKLKVNPQGANCNDDMVHIFCLTVSELQLKTNLEELLK